ncbi:MAG: response regulator transcription factor [Desulfobulbaceae bacterium]|nr:response regulator transcription factor [Desulfobulbaceae bacterium]
MDKPLSCNLLIFEDDAAIRTMLADFFTSQGATVATAEDGRNSFERIKREQPDLIVLDVIMPYKNGFLVLKKLRDAGSNVPVLMLTEKDSVEDKVAGLELGADDYLAKPFSTRELLARVRVLLRRARQGVRADGALQLEHLHIDRMKREVQVLDYGPVSLTKTEFDLLFDLAEHVGTVRTHAQLMQDVLGYAPGIKSRALSMHIANIRRKFEEIGVGGTIHIRTVPGVGYVLAVRRGA